MRKRKHNLPPITPTHRYRCMILVPYEASTMPVQTITPPSITTGLLPYRFTSILLTGPAHRRDIFYLFANSAKDKRITTDFICSLVVMWHAGWVTVFFFKCFWHIFFETVCFPLTCCIHRSKHDWGNPGNLAVGDWKIFLNLLEIDCEGLGKGVRESYGDESTEDDGPAPASVWWGVA